MYCHRDRATYPLQSYACYYDIVFSSRHTLILILSGSNFSLLVCSNIEKWQIFVQLDKGLKPTLSQIVLALEFVATTIRMLAVIDPFGKHGIWTFELTRFYLSGHQPWATASAFLLILVCILSLVNNSLPSCVPTNQQSLLLSH